MRLRVGVVLWLLSWVPYGILLGLSGDALAAAWAFEITLGIVGLFVAGSVFASSIKTIGWRRTPSVAWTSFRSGRPPVAAPD
ncbi:MAG TPA: hypothetical protein VGJ03_01610 [Acidimicrobiales bacterium]